MHQRGFAWRVVGFATMIAALSVGCQIVEGLPSVELYQASTGTGAGTSTTSTSTGSGTGANHPCVPESTMTCYSGPAGTEDAGVCKGGTATCKADGSGFGDCVGGHASARDVREHGGSGVPRPRQLRDLGQRGRELRDDDRKRRRRRRDGEQLRGRFLRRRDPVSNLTLTAGSGTAAYVIELNPKGTPAWGRSFPGAMNQTTVSNVVAVDSMGNPAIGGWTGTSVTFDGSSTVGPGTFVAKLDGSNGQLLWAQGLNANVEDVGDFIDDMAFTSTGDLVVGGRFTSELTLGDAPTSAPPGGHASGFVARLSNTASGSSTTANGGWAQVLCSAATNTNASCEVTGVRVVALDNILVAGDFQGELDIVSPVNALSAKGTRDAFVAQLSSMGGFLGRSKSAARARPWPLSTWRPMPTVARSW